MTQENSAAPSKIIERSNMFKPLLEADPSFQRKWEEFQYEYRSDNELPHYLALSDLARHLIESLETGNTQRFDAIFNVVELWHLNGDSYVQGAATVGLIEDLQNTNLHRGKTRPEDFLPWLQPETLRWWGRVHDFWTSGKPLVPDPPLVPPSGG